MTFSMVRLNYKSLATKAHFSFSKMKSIKTLPVNSFKSVDNFLYWFALLKKHLNTPKHFWHYLSAPYSIQTIHIQEILFPNSVDPSLYQLLQDSPELLHYRGKKYERHWVESMWCHQYNISAHLYLLSNHPSYLRTQSSIYGSMISSSLDSYWFPTFFP